MTIRCRLSYLVWLSYLPRDSARAIAERLRFSANLMEALDLLLAILTDVSSLALSKPSQVVDRLEHLPLLAVYAAFLIARSDAIKQPLWSYATRWRYIKPKNNGESLKERGLPPSPIYRTILKALRDAWLDGEIQTPEEEEALLGKLISWNQLPGSPK